MQDAVAERQDPEGARLQRSSVSAAKKRQGKISFRFTPHQIIAGVPY
jgi:hypothetical protein